MRENIMEWMKIILPALVTIIGFIVNFFLTRNSIRREIEKRKVILYWKNYLKYHWK